MGQVKPTRKDLLQPFTCLSFHLSTNGYHLFLSSYTFLGTIPIASKQATSNNLSLTTKVTLILLSSISVIIVARSYLLRRRFRRQVEDALRNGQVLTPDGLTPGLVGLSSSATSKLLGPPPKLWDVWVRSASASSLRMRRPSTPDEDESQKTAPDKFPWNELRVSRVVHFSRHDMVDTTADYAFFSPLAIIRRNNPTKTRQV